MSVSRRAVPSAAAIVLAIAVLAGCTPAEEPDAPTPAPTEAPAEEPTPGPTTQPVGTPVEVPCDALVPADVMYLYNANFGLVDPFDPAAGSFAANALAYSGVACRWQNQSSNQVIDVSVAQLDEETLTALKNAAFAESQMVPTYGEEAYFSVDGGLGTAQVFQGPYWIVAESDAFFEPGDATEIVQSAIAGLGA